MRNYSIFLFLVFSSLAPSAKCQIERLPASSIVTIAGGEANHVQGKDFSFPGATGMVRDAAGNIYFSLQFMSRVYRLDVNGRVTVYAGNGVRDKNLEDVSAISSPLLNPGALAVDAKGNLYISCWHGVVRVDARSHVVSTVLTIPYKQSAPAVSILDIQDMTIGPDGALYFSDGGDWRIKRYSFHSRSLKILAGNGLLGAAQVGVPAISSPLRYPQSVAVSWRGTVYFTTLEPSVYRIRSRDGKVEGVSIRLPNQEMPLGDYDIPTHVALDSRGHLFVTQGNRSRILRVVLKSGYVSVYAGTGSQEFNGDGFRATHATVTPGGVVSDREGNLVISDRCRIRYIDVTTHRIKTIVGNGLPFVDETSNSARRARLWEPAAAVSAPDGSLYITSSFNNRILRLDKTGKLKTVAGGADGVLGSVAGPALQVDLYAPQGAWIDTNGDVYFSDYDNRILRRLDSETGLVSNFATTTKNTNSAGVYLYAAAALIRDENYFYMSDPTGHRVWRISKLSGVVEPYVGTALSVQDLSGEVRSAQLGYASGLAIDSAGILYIAGGIVGTEGGGIFRVDQATGILVTILDGLRHPIGLAFQSANVLCFSESGANQVKCMDLSDRTVKVIAGNGEAGFGGDGGPAECAKLYRPSGISFDLAGDLYIADTGNQRIRRVRLGQNPAICQKPQTRISQKKTIQ